MLPSKVDLVMLEGRLLDSLFIASKKLCWDADDMVFLGNDAALRPSVARFQPGESGGIVYKKFQRDLDSAVAQVDDSTLQFEKFNGVIKNTRQICKQAPKSANCPVLAQNAVLLANQLNTVAIAEDLSEPESTEATTKAKDAATPVKFPGAQAEAFHVPDGIGKVVDESATCTMQQPEKKVVWVKTHKTGSSTMTNMFHRFAYKHNISLALPKDDMYYHWPRKTEIITSVEYPYETEPGKQTFDMLCSGHIVYNREEIEKVVPVAKYVTIIRNPLSHFKSSWSYWGMSKHLDQNGEPWVMEKFLDDPFTNINSIPENDRRMIHNNIAFDLGLGETATINEIESYVTELSNPLTGFDFVLVGEHLDESLVLLRRKFCWELEDVVHYSLKVSKRPSKPMEDLHIRNIMEFNAVDAAIYDHFNRSLWNAIKNAPYLMEEVEALRALREHMVDECQSVKMSNRKGRFYMMTEPKESLKARCARLTMDSIEFSRYFKVKQNVPYGECIRPGTASYMMFIRPRFSGVIADAMTNAIYRKALKYHQPLGIPSPVAVGAHSNAYTVYSMDDSDRATWIADGSPVFKDEPLSELIVGRNARFITVVPDPVERFLQAWDDMNIEKELADVGHKSGLLLALSSARPKVIQVMEKIRNTFSKDFGSVNPNEITKAADTSKIIRSNTFSYALPGTYAEEGLVFLARLICWDMSDLVYIRKQMFVPRKRDGLLQNVIAAIEKFNRVDHRLFQAFERSFKSMVEAEYRFDEDLARFRALVDEKTQACLEFASKPQDTLVAVAQDTGISEEQRMCAYMHMEPQAFASYAAKMYTSSVVRSLKD